MCCGFDGVDDLGDAVAVLEGRGEGLGLFAAGEGEDVVGLVGEALVPSERV